MSGMIGLSCSEQGRFTETWVSLFQLREATPDAFMQVACGANIAENRNALAKWFLASGAEWLFYADDDQVFAPNTLTRLLARNTPVVSGLYLAREYPFAPHVYDDADDPETAYTTVGVAETSNGLLRVKSTGAGALLVRRPVFEKLQTPYWRLGQTVPEAWGDDIDFCRRVREAGFGVYVDLHVGVGHKTNGTIWPQWTPQGELEAFLRVGNQTVKVGVGQEACQGMVR